MESTMHTHVANKGSPSKTPMAIKPLHLTVVLLLLLSTGHHLRAALPENPAAPPPVISSNSILIALLDSQYTQLSELLEKALLLQTLENAIANGTITVFAPTNEALERDLDPEFNRFLLEPGNIKSLQTLLFHHILPTKLSRGGWPTDPTRSTPTRRRALSHEYLEFSYGGRSEPYVGAAKVVYFNSIVRHDGIIHGVEKVIVPKSVEREFNKNGRNPRSIAAVEPEGAPEINPRTNKLSKRNAISAPGGGATTIYKAKAPGHSPSPAPGGPHHHLDGEKQVNDFIQTLTFNGGYNEMAEILVNLTNLAAELGNLINEGYAFTVLAPSDEAMAKLTTEQLSDSGAPERIVYYHIVPEYQTEESMYNAVRRFKTVSYGTLRLPHKIEAKEADGSVRFGTGKDSGYLFDPDIYTDGRISVQGIDGVLFPPEESDHQNAKRGK
ncbi:hypothetical protein ACP275_06G082200 [Erythranthe tilingii]